MRSKQTTKASDDWPVEHKSAARAAKKARQDYIRSMTGELAIMAKAERLEFVAYLLDMAYVEISDVMRGARPDDVASHAPKQRAA